MVAIGLSGRGGAFKHSREGSNIKNFSRTPKFMLGTVFRGTEWNELKSLNLIVWWLFIFGQ
jgi:hypothetical protein